MGPAFARFVALSILIGALLWSTAERVATVGAPLTLLANLWRIVYDVSNSVDYSPLVFWSDFVQDGGVNFLAIGSGTLLAYVIESATRTKANTTPNQSGNGTSTCAGLPSPV
jgi:hypothetical protein